MIGRTIYDFERRKFFPSFCLSLTSRPLLINNRRLFFRMHLFLPSHGLLRNNHTQYGNPFRILGQRLMLNNLLTRDLYAPIHVL